jgi:hypothetical protein
VNQTYEYYAPLRAIFGQPGAPTAEPATLATDTAVQPMVSKKRVAVNPELEKLKALGNVEIAIYTGQFTRDEASGIDLLIVGDINQHALQKFVGELETQEGKDIRFTVMPAPEFAYRRQINDRFITTVLSAKKQVLIDKNEVL